MGVPYKSDCMEQRAKEDRAKKHPTVSSEVKLQAINHRGRRLLLANLSESPRPRLRKGCVSLSVQ